MENPKRESQPERTLPRDPVWEAYQHNSFEWFQELIETLSFREEVDEAVVQQFRPVRKAVLYSYFEYDLLEVAYDRAVLSLEMALRRRYRELHSEVEDLDREHPDEPYNLEGLLDWADGNDLLEGTGRRPTPKKDDKDDEHVAHHLRELRNNVAHRDRASQYGTLAINAVAEIVNLINHLYGDPKLRHQRHQAIVRAREALAEVFDRSGVLVAPEDAVVVQDQPGNRMLVFEASALYHDNRGNKPVTYFAFQPIFDPRKGAPDELKIPTPVLVTAVSHYVSDGAHEMVDTKGRSWVLDEINREENNQMFSAWRDQIGDRYRSALDDFRFTCGELKRKLQAPEPMRSQKMTQTGSSQSET